MNTSKVGIQVKRYVKSSSDPRKNTNYLWDLIINHIISKDTVIDAFCAYLSDDDVGEVLRDLDIDEQDKKLKEAYYYLYLA